MALTESRDIALGAPCPDFRLHSVDGKVHGRDDFREKPVLVVMFICNHCPYVQAVEDRLIRLARETGPRGVAFVGVCSNDAVTYPDDGFDKLAERWRRKGYGFPFWSFRLLADPPACRLEVTGTGRAGELARTVFGALGK